MKKHVSREEKISLIELMNVDPVKYTFEDIARSKGVSIKTVKRWNACYKKDPEMTPKPHKPRTGRPKILTLDEENTVISWLSDGAREYGFKNDRWSAPRIKKLIKDKLDKNLCETQIKKMIRDNGKKYKKTEKRYAESDKEKQVQWEKEGVKKE